FASTPVIDHALGCGTDGCALVWSENGQTQNSCKSARAARITSSGTWLDTTPIDLQSCSSAVYAVAAAGNPGQTFDHQTYMTAWSSSGPELSSARIRAQSGVRIFND